MDKKNEFLFGFVILFLLSWILLLYHFSPEYIISVIGVNNSYLILVILGLFAGLSSLSAAPFYTVVGTFSVGGLDILKIALFGGLSLSLGHIVYYFLGLSTNTLLSKKFKKKIKKFTLKFKDNPKLIPIFSFVYFAFTPFPNELVLIPLGVIEYSFEKTVLILTLGNIFLVFLLSYFSFLIF